MKRLLLSALLRMLFYPGPSISLTGEEERAFDQLYESAIASADRTIRYDIDVPKYKFLHYIIRTKTIVFHGSNNAHIDHFEPRLQTLFAKGSATAVFATKDPLWPFFYAVFRRSALVGNFRNGSVAAGPFRRPYYFYSLTKATLRNDPWTDGVIYLLPDRTFKQSPGAGGLYIDEWISESPVEPIARLPVGPDDFVFRDKVAVHAASESVGRTWLLYKIRTWK